MELVCHCFFDNRFFQQKMVETKYCRMKKGFIQKFNGPLFNIFMGLVISIFMLLFTCFDTKKGHMLFIVSMLSNNASRL